MAGPPPSSTPPKNDNVDVSCAPLSGSTFPVGTTTVNCTATDDSGNTDVGSFDVTVTTAANGTDDLLETINSDNDIPKNVKNSLLGPLKKVSKNLNDGNPDNDLAVCDKLAEYIENLNDKEASGKFDGTSVDVDSLRDDAEAIQEALGCL